MQSRFRTESCTGTESISIVTYPERPQLSSRQSGTTNASDTQQAQHSRSSQLSDGATSRDPEQNYTIAILVRTELSNNRDDTSDANNVRVYNFIDAQSTSSEGIHLVHALSRRAETLAREQVRSLGNGIPEADRSANRTWARMHTRPLPQRRSQAPSPSTPLLPPTTPNPESRTPARASQQQQPTMPSTLPPRPAPPFPEHGSTYFASSDQTHTMMRWLQLHDEQRVTRNRAMHEARERREEQNMAMLAIADRQALEDIEVPRSPPPPYSPPRTPE